MSNNDATAEPEQQSAPTMDPSVPPRDLEDVVDIDDGIPDAVGSADVARRGRVLRMSDLDAVGSRGVQWVRSSDLLAQQSARLAGRGFDFQTGIVERARSAAATGVHDFAGRARRLPPRSAFGRGSQDALAATRSGVGLS